MIMCVTGSLGLSLTTVCLSPYICISLVEIWIAPLWGWIENTLTAIMFSWWWVDHCQQTPQVLTPSLKMDIKKMWWDILNQCISLEVDVYVSVSVEFFCECLLCLCLYFLCVCESRGGERWKSFIFKILYMRNISLWHIAKNIMLLNMIKYMLYFKHFINFLNCLTRFSFPETWILKSWLTDKNLRVNSKISCIPFNKTSMGSKWFLKNVTMGYFTQKTWLWEKSILVALR